MQPAAIRLQGAASLLVLSPVLLFALLLNGCTSVPLGPSPSRDAGVPAQANARKPAQGVPALPPAGSGRGGYYQDDGPADVIPEGLLDRPDAEPKIEPLHPRANRPYSVFGKTYTPVTDDKPFRQRGIGSWYGKKFHGQRTSSGEPYDMFGMTAAHPTLPIPSYVRVTHVATGKQVIVRVNDRGPFHSDRIIDLSYTAALKLGYLGKGSGEIEVERLLPEDIAQWNSRKVEPAPASSGVELAAVPASSVVTVARSSDNSTAARPASAENTAPAAAGPRVMAAAGAWYLQLGAYSQQANAEQARLRLASAGSAMPALEVVPANGLFRLFGGPYATRAEAEGAAQALRAASSLNAIIVQR